jgi:hypothetical protein
MLLVFRPFRIGDGIEDNVQVLIPNGQLWGAAMSNLSAYGTRRISLSVPALLNKDAETISSRLRSFLKEDKRVLDSPSPSVTASNLTDRGAEFLVQAWVKTEDADSVRNDLVRYSMASAQALTPPSEAHWTLRVVGHPIAGLPGHCPLARAAASVKLPHWLDAKHLGERGNFRPLLIDRLSNSSGPPILSAWPGVARCSVIFLSATAAQWAVIACAVKAVCRAGRTGRRVRPMSARIAGFLIVGMFGSAGVRTELVMAKSLILPASNSGRTIARAAS